ncbi:putative amino acid transporter [Cystobasidium minutum MCA 4210]|uniref:putative amino acid transporter n=1 Tax=Cystobasidium minutum MCA 4210 TaxID=1397322 RepID=UPI0034CF4722|eukprot:jgi/Rhomi1/211152/estExt_Genemark1.C_4_t20289
MSSVDTDTKAEPAPYQGKEIFVDQDEEQAVFKTGEGVTNYRTVSWPKASVIFLKLIFAVGVLSIPDNLHTLGAVGGSIVVVVWGLINTHLALTMGDFVKKHPSVHTIADAAAIVGKKWKMSTFLKEMFGVIYGLTWIFLSGASIIGVATALNALSDHGACTVVFAAVAMIGTIIFASFPRFGQIGVMTWIGFFLTYVAVLIVVIAVTQTDRPAAAPATGPYDLDFVAIATPTFQSAMTAVSTIFVSYAGVSAFMPIIAEMRRPQDYKKAVGCSMTLVTISYLTFSLVVYAYCGQYVASPALGSAGPTIKKVAYGIALPGLWITSILYLHLAAKYFFVRILRNSKHLQSNSVVHWGTWFGSTIVCGILAFIVAEAIPFFGLLLGLIGALFLAPSTLCIPPLMWFHDNQGLWRTTKIYKAKAAYYAFIFVLGLFVTVAGTYSAAVSIRDGYRANTIGTAFSCADNSGSS